MMSLFRVGGGMMKDALEAVLLPNLPPSHIIFGWTGTPPENIGVRDGRLARCPEASNCVSSQSTDPVDAIEPLKYMTSENELWPI